MVGAINLHSGLSPPRTRACRAHQKKSGAWLNSQTPRLLVYFATSIYFLSNKKAIHGATSWVPPLKGRTEYTHRLPIFEKRKWRLF